jgi:hypothetical protein
MIGFIGTWVTISLNYSECRAISDLQHLQFTVTHALGFLVSTRHLLATDLNTETNISNHYEALTFLVQWPWNLGTQLKLCLAESESESESYITTDSQLTSLSWNKAPIWGLRPDIYLSLTITAQFLWASSLTTGWVWLLYMLLALASVVFLGSESLWTCNHILLSQIWDFPFCRLLRLAGSRWRYSTPPPHRVLSLNFWVWVWVWCYDRQSVGQFVLE